MMRFTDFRSSLFPHAVVSSWILCSCYLLGSGLWPTSLTGQVSVAQPIPMNPVPQYRPPSQGASRLPPLPNYFDGPSATPVREITPNPTTRIQQPQIARPAERSPIGLHHNSETNSIESKSHTIDPRKFGSPCLGPNQYCRFRPVGIGGQPYQDRQPGGCQCDQRRFWRTPDFSVHWPRPFSAKLDPRFPSLATAPQAACPHPRRIDWIDGLSDFKLINYQRSDNGYCGPGADRFGCLGESKLRSVVR